jgi:putative two-component system response regulator
MKILVVDDDDIALAVAEKVLKSEGHQVILAEDGEEALKTLQMSDIQIVISDWNMPNMDGIELCHRIRNTPGLEDIYIVMVTARNSQEDKIQALTAKANEIISKPFEAAELTLRVRNAEQILSTETIELVLFSLAKLAEAKDNETGAHLERMREYAKVLAEYLMTMPELRGKLSPRFPEFLYLTSPLHDIGKIGIPDHILLKPGSLNDDEWKIMKRHTDIGAEKLNETLDKFPKREFLRITRDIVWCHHERWDGTGYPRGLKGDEIPLSARIVALADVYDAVTMKRVYKAAMPHDMARGIILSGKDKHFDPMVVDAFVALEDKFIDIKTKFKD